MIRQETPSHWLLVTHPDHARVAGQFADAWGNEQFDRPEPYDSLRYAIYHHDDGWEPRDRLPSLTRDRKPEAFTRQLVGRYSAFEEIDLPAYLKVRADATDVVAAIDPCAGLFVSMHTYNLLSEQADIDTIRPEHRQAHGEFLDRQLGWQRATAQTLGIDDQKARRGFEFLQCCDNLSLIVCSGHDVPRDLRHLHPDRSGRLHAIRCTPVNPRLYTLDPWPGLRSEIVLDIPYRSIAKADCGSLSSFHHAWRRAPLHVHTLILRPASA